MPPELENYKPKDKGYPSIHTNRRYSELATALGWNMNPEDFRKLSSDTQLEMEGFVFVKSLIERFFFDKADEKAEKAAREIKNSSGGSGRR